MDYRSFPRALTDMISVRKVISLITGIIRSQLIWPIAKLLMCCGNEAGSYLRLIDSCITHLKRLKDLLGPVTRKEKREEVTDITTLALPAVCPRWTAA